MFFSKRNEMTWDAYDATVKNAPDHVLIDVRTNEEWAQGHSDDARHVPAHELVSKPDAFIPDRATKVFLHCRSGGRAGRVYDALKREGYKNLTCIVGTNGGRF